MGHTDTYPAILLLMALIGIYTQEMALIWSAIGILCLQLILQQSSFYRPWMFVAAVIGWMILYTWIQSREIEHFENTLMVETRPCTVYFTKYINECDNGDYYKDEAVLLWNKDKLVGNLQKQIDSDTATRNANKLVLDKYGTAKSALEIETQIIAENKAIITQEQGKGSEQNLKTINDANLKIATAKTDANLLYTRTIPSYRTTNAVLDKNIKTNQDKLSAIQATDSFKNIQKIIDERTSKPYMRCKNNYQGWYELNSTSNPGFKDPVKNTEDPLLQQKGPVSTWAFCYKTNKSYEEWAKNQSAFENVSSAYPDISYASEPVPVGEGNGLGMDKYTSRISFQNFSPLDKSECDDALVKPDNPVIANGLLEITLNKENNMIKSIRRIMYSNNDPRYIDPNLSQNISQVDPVLLQSLFFPWGIDINLKPPPNSLTGWKKNVTAYTTLNNQIYYQIYYLYKDPKCKRFYGNTNHTGVISAAYKGNTKYIGDIFAKNSAFNIKTNIPGAILDDPDTVQYILSNAIDADKTILNPPRVSVFPGTFKLTAAGLPSNLPIANRTYNSILNTDKVPLLKYLKDNRDYLVGPYTDALRAKIAASESIIAKYNIQLNTAPVKTATLIKTLIKNEQTNIQKYNAALTKYTNVAAKLERFATDIQSGLYQQNVSSILQSYIGRPINDFIVSYNDSYVSNDRTLYLKVWGKDASGNDVYLYDPKTDSDGKPTYEITNPIIADVETDTTTYEEAVLPPDDTFVGTMLESFEDTPLVILYDRYNNVLKTYMKDGNTIPTITDYISTPANADIYRKITSMDIGKGVSITVENPDGTALTYNNSKKATEMKRIDLNSAMTGGSCTTKNVLDQCYVAKIKIRPI